MWSTNRLLYSRFVPPAYVGGVPIDSYAVEYKEARSEWTQAKRRVWPAGNSIVFRYFSPFSL